MHSKNQNLIELSVQMSCWTSPSEPAGKKTLSAGMDGHGMSASAIFHVRWPPAPCLPTQSHVLATDRRVAETCGSCSSLWADGISTLPAKLFMVWLPQLRVARVGHCLQNVTVNWSMGRKWMICEVFLWPKSGSHNLGHLWMSRLRPTSLDRCRIWSSYVCMVKCVLLNVYIANMEYTKLIEIT